MDDWINTPLPPASPLKGRIIEAREKRKSVNKEKSPGWFRACPAPAGGLLNGTPLQGKGGKMDNWINGKKGWKEEKKLYTKFTNFN